MLPAQHDAGAAVPGLIAASDLEKRFHHLPAEIERMAPFVQQAFLIHLPQGGMEGMACKGLDMGGVHPLVESHLVAGRLPSVEQKGEEGQLLISLLLAHKLRLKLGAVLRVSTLEAKPRYRKLKIVGMYTTHLPQVETHVAFCTTDWIQRLNHWSADQYNGYDLFLKTGIKPTRQLREKILGHLDQKMRLVRMDHRYMGIDGWFNIIQRHIFLCMGFVWFVSACMLMAVTIMQLMERKPMMQLLCILGASSKQVIILLTMHGLYRLLPAFLYGNLLAMGLGIWQYHAPWIRLDPSLYYIDSLPIAWDFADWLVLNLVTLAMTMATLCITLFLLLQSSRGKQALCLSDLRLLV